jgi:hypothetical protein
MDRIRRNLNANGELALRLTLAAFNDSATTHWLHPTKGWRPLSERRSHAALLTAEIKRGLRSWSSHTIQELP